MVPSFLDRRNREEYWRRYGADPGYQHRQVEPIEVLMECLFGSLSMLEFRPCLGDAGIAREAF